MTIHEQIGMSLMEVRKSKKITRTDLAAKLNVSYAYLAHVEAGRKNLTFSQLENICAAMGIESIDVKLRYYGKVRI